MMYDEFEAHLLSPENECRHGRLPDDRTLPCGCWDDLEQPANVRPLRRLGGRELDEMIVLFPHPEEKIAA